MREIIKNKQSTLIIFFIILSVFFLTQCINKQTDETTADIKHTSADQFIGSASCANCHKNICDSNSYTAHYLTSQLASEKTIKGSFETGSNIFMFDNYTQIAMEKRNNGFYQVEYDNGIERKARKFDIVVGSATKGQTYLYWWKDTLFQLPLTYFTPVNQWSNSPGYPGRVIFGRPVTSRCLECHTTYAQTISLPNAQFEKFDHNVLYGVGCEKCHGPAAKHVQFQTTHPSEKNAKYIINPASFSRQQKLDLCSLCHGGRLSKTKPSFQFRPGDTLTNYFVIDTAKKSAEDIDVHGNQYGLLAASKCFKNSEMTCNTCHSPHENENGKLALFSQRCISCHNGTNGHICKLNAAIGSVIKQNCIDCHMPEKPSKAITVLLQGQAEPTSATMRTHFITIYPNETKKIMLFLKNNKQNHLTKKNADKSSL